MAGDSEQSSQHSEKVHLAHAWWLQYLTGLTGVSTLGASITFGVLATSENTPEARSQSDYASNAIPHIFKESTIRTFLATAFLLFLVNLGIANMLYSLIFFYEKLYFDNEAEFHGKKLLCFIPFSIALHLAHIGITTLMLSAYALLALAVVGYVEVVGWITLAYVGVYWVICVFFWVKQLCVTWNSVKAQNSASAD